MKIVLREFTQLELEDLVRDLGYEPYRARQIFRWIYEKNIDSIDMMSDIPQELRSRLKEKVYIGHLDIIQRLQSQDGTEKFLLSLEDGEKVESVLIPEDKRLTLCISTQAGCAMGCTFCFTAKGGLTRNLKTWEITGQYLEVQKVTGRRITNIVFMGMGEPLANYKNVVKAIGILTHPAGPRIGSRKITLSTSGLIPGIIKLGQSGFNINLAISLNATTDMERNLLMPVNRKYPLSQLIHTLKNYPLPPGRRISIEYVMIKDINSSINDAHRLARLLKGIRCKINLIPFNPFPGTAYRAPTEKHIHQFQEIVANHGYSVFIRKSRGADIMAACGLLRVGPRQALDL